MPHAWYRATTKNGQMKLAFAPLRIIHSVVTAAKWKMHYFESYDVWKWAEYSRDTIKVKADQVLILGALKQKKKNNKNKRRRGISQRIQTIVR
jgi:hypothetical protein